MKTRLWGSSLAVEENVQRCQPELGTWLSLKSTCHSNWGTFSAGSEEGWPGDTHLHSQPWGKGDRAPGLPASQPSLLAEFQTSERP